MTVLELQDVDSGYGDIQILNDVSIKVENNEIVCLVGPNGAGKSTVLKTIFGLVKPWSGVISLHDEEISGLEPEEMVRKGVGYVPQKQNVFGSLSVDENLRMGGVAQDDELDPIIENLYDEFDIISGKKYDDAGSLSGGQQQLVALARALVMEPDVLLVDEPSAGLAPKIVTEVFEHITKINDLGTSILMIEQNARQALKISDRGYVLDQGNVRFENDAATLLNDDSVGELYIGTSPSN
jgi:branched-chain amino acid transport system ATP-binding protein